MGTFLEQFSMFYGKQSDEISLIAYVSICKRGADSEIKFD